MPGRSCRIIVRWCSTDIVLLSCREGGGSPDSDRTRTSLIGRPRFHFSRVAETTVSTARMYPRGLALKRAEVLWAVESGSGRRELLPLAVLDPLAPTPLEEGHDGADQAGEQSEQ